MSTDTHVSTGPSAPTDAPSDTAALCVRGLWKVFGPNAERLVGTVG